MKKKKKYNHTNKILKQSNNNNNNNNNVARCSPAAATVQVLGVNLLLTPNCHESWCP
jgi:hypothetical protein